jgi:ribose/xylose/arabinose/galactoside ABC-type transport system permease subunit
VFAGRGAWFYVPMPIIVFSGAALVMDGFLSQTSIGRFVYAQCDTWARNSASHSSCEINSARTGRSSAEKRLRVRGE